ncbi:MAG: hypothetical protein QXO67_02215 [Candidatus Bathyarchaeia archaeon]
MSELEKIPDRELKNRFISLWHSIFDYECYGISDLLELQALADELERRGYISETRKPLIRKRKEQNHEV